MDEIELISRCINKDKQAWDIFVKRYAKLIYWAIKKRFSMSSFTFSDDDAQNIFQEVFLSIIKEDRLTQLKDSKMISGWLAMVASNKTIDFMREKIRSSQRFAFNPPQLKDTNSLKKLFDKETESIVKDIINTLSEKEKIIISLNLFEEKSHKEIGCILGIPVNTISTIISRVKVKLKEQLKDKGFSG
jgi:RNA polymerase sigma-70 factor (ECF subfamily)